MKKESAEKKSFFNNSMNLFVKDGKGKTVYYPWALWGKGYYVDSQQEKQIGKSRAFLFFAVFGCVMVMFLMSTFFKTSLAAGFILSLILFQGINYFRIKKATTGLKECDTCLTTHQRIKASVNNCKLWQLIVREGIFLYFLTLTFFRPLSLGGASHKIDAVFWPVIFGIFVVYYAYLLFIKVTDKK